jgi:hypothetical protein
MLILFLMLLLVLCYVYFILTSPLACALFPLAARGVVCTCGDVVWLWGGGILLFCVILHNTFMTLEMTTVTLDIQITF